MEMWVQWALRAMPDHREQQETRDSRVRKDPSESLAPQVQPAQSAAPGPPGPKGSRVCRVRSDSGDRPGLLARKARPVRREVTGGPEHKALRDPSDRPFQENAARRAFREPLVDWEIKARRDRSEVEVPSTRYRAPPAPKARKDSWAFKDCRG